MDRLATLTAALVAQGFDVTSAEQAAHGLLARAVMAATSQEETFRASANAREYARIVQRFVSIIEADEAP